MGYIQCPHLDEASKGPAKLSWDEWINLEIRDGGSEHDIVWKVMGLGPEVLQKLANGIEESSGLLHPERTIQLARDARQIVQKA